MSNRVNLHVYLQSGQLLFLLRNTPCVFLDVEGLDKLFISEKFRREEIYSAVDSEIRFLTALGVMNHLISEWILVEGSHLMVLGCIIVCRHDSQERLSTILEFEHII